jgi:hypothetical protein
VSPSDLACRSCFFWLLQAGMELPDGRRRGQCRLRAPRVLQIGPRGGIGTRWPMTTEDEWCGQHAVPEDQP